MRQLFALLFLSGAVQAQMIDNTTSFRTVDADSYVRINYENDFFTATDYYYTQGINMEFVSPWFNTFFINKLLIKGQDQVKVGIAAEHNGFTPTSTESDSILYGDRPFAATLTMRVFSMSYHIKLRSRITSSFSFGVIGPSAGGRAMQSTIHQWINDDQPHGWEHQIQNDIVLNYTVGMEKSLVQIPRAFLLDGFATVQTGTLNTKLSSGLVLVVGKVNSRLASMVGREFGTAGKNKFSFHGYCQPQLNVVGYDATLQGGLFNKDSPYTIAAGDMNRLTFQTNMGLVMQAGPMYMEYFFTFLTQEFSTGLSHTWGGVRVGARW